MQVSLNPNSLNASYQSFPDNPNSQKAKASKSCPLLVTIALALVIAAVAVGITFLVTRNFYAAGPDFDP